MKYTTNKILVSKAIQNEESKFYANIYSLSLRSRGLPKSCQVLFIVH